MQLPLVGLKCKHVACFEGETFLQMHLNKSEWVCPVCYNLIRKNELVRDPLIEDILHSTQRAVEQIEFDQLGNFKISEPEKTKPKQKSKIECVTLDDNEDDATNFNNINEPLIKPKIEKYNFNSFLPSSSSSFNPYQSSPFSGPSIFDTLNLVSTAMNRPTGTLNQSSTVTSSSLSNHNRVGEVIELSSDDENSVIVLDDSDLEDVNNNQTSNHFQPNSSQNTDSDQSSTYLFSPLNRSNRARLFDDSTDENTELSDEERLDGSDLDEVDNSSIDTDRTELDDDDDISNRRRLNYIFSDSSNDFPYSDSDLSNDSNQSTLSSLNSNSSLSTNSSTNSNSSSNNNNNASFTSSSSTLLQSRGSLRSRRKRRRLF